MEKGSSASEAAIRADEDLAALEASERERLTSALSEER